MSGAEERRQAGERQPPDTVNVFLNGLQLGMLGALWMLAWAGLNATWHRLSAWSAENLLANAFHPDAPIAAGFGWNAVSGLALYLVIYGLLGGFFALAVGPRKLPPARLMLLALVFALAWYYFSFHLLWKTIAPAIAYLHPEQATMVGHVLYGLSIGRNSAHVRPAETPFPEATAQPEPTSDSVTPGK